MRFPHLCLTSALALAAALPALAEPVFNRVASFATPDNMAEGEDRARATSAEIITATEDGMTLIYSDSPLGVIGMVDITDPAAPRPLGNVAMGGEPTTTVVIGGLAFAGVNTSESRAAPSGKLVTVDLAKKAVVAECDLGGQPDSVARAPDGSFIAVAIENERDEDVADGDLPQMPAGYVVRLPVKDGAVDCAGLQKIDVTGLAEVAPEDPEPEFLAVNEAGEIVVTLQENNHILVIGADGKVASHFSAGAVDLDGIDTKKDGRLDFTGSAKGVLREPDGVKWIDADHFVTANEGDWKGGSRSFTIWKKDGTVVYESGASLEREIAAIGHYPDFRNKKGAELESVEVATFDGARLLFVASERASIVAVYDLTDPAAPVLKQLLPSGVSPEGMVALPARGLLATANEVDLREDGLAPAHVMVYARAEGTAAYPMITSAGSDPLIGWAALSALAADPATPGRLYAANDSALGAAPTIYTIDATQVPARITAALPVTRGGDPAQLMDIEGLAADGEGGFWIATEGRSDKMVPHGIVHVNDKGEIRETIGLPPELAANETRFGFEGITVAGNVLWLAVQREWADDPKGMVKLVAYDTKEKTWGAVHYPLDAPAKGAWMGLSEITLHGDWVYVVERDNQIADKAAVKKIYRVKAADLAPAKLGEALPVVQKELVRDLLPDLKVLNGYVPDKVEGFAIDAGGIGWVVTDNDGIDDSSGETLFWSLGKL
ncbi:esterase-like activity of phytase family protein [Pseudogemmobacter blasticus]|uniref:Alkaline phosphatase n=1 Tax=Fuscovulum blasticum DSM 2131 TaxID=1188250 RepID=A0A2T4J9I7_FUSBL|nr:esterase-like activity of phytase family protein [Fuscovulum blasticum]PTE14575.1 alkaline phosphatase [Fuscovulum blasticum DSM 2131]